MGALALLNLMLYAYVVSRAYRYFHGHPCSRRDADKVIVVGVGMLSALFVLAQGWVLASAPYIHTKLHSNLAILYLFCLSNGVLYLSIISAMERVLQERHTCSTPRRYFP